MIVVFFQRGFCCMQLLCAYQVIEVEEDIIGYVAKLLVFEVLGRRVEPHRLVEAELVHRLDHLLGGPAGLLFVCACSSNRAAGCAGVARK